MIPRAKTQRRKVFYYDTKTLTLLGFPFASPRLCASADSVIPRVKGDGCAGGRFDLRFSNVCVAFNFSAKTEDRVGPKRSVFQLIVQINSIITGTHHPLPQRNRSTPTKLLTLIQVGEFAKECCRVGSRG